MTALTQYARLETVGRWRPREGEAGREVVVSFGDATLVLAEGDGRPLTHWSLPALVRLNPGAQPALYAPDEDGSETLELDDDLMVGAIEKVRGSLAPRVAPLPPRLRRPILGGIAAVAVVAVLVWVPGWLESKALAVVPASKRIEMGATVLGHLQLALGAACRDPLGAEALAKLHARVLGAGGQVVILPNGPATPLRLPGGITVLSREMVERAAEPAVVAGQLLAARESAAGREPLAALLEDAGPLATLGLLTTGEMSASALARYAADLLSDPPAPAAPDDLGPAFAAAQVPSTPYARDLDPTGDTTAVLAAADAFTGGAAPLLLSDSEWVALQNICGG